MTAVGLGFGDVVICELLTELGMTPDTGSENGVAIGFMAEAQKLTAIQIATALRAAGTCVSLASQAQKPKTFFGGASDNHACGRAIYIGPDDVDAGQVKMKTLATREEQVLKISEILSPTK